MINFRNFLQLIEMALLSKPEDGYVSEHERLDDTDMIPSTAKRVSGVKVNNELYDIHHLVPSFDRSKVAYYAVHKKTGIVHMSMEGYRDPDKSINVTYLTGHPDTKIKAHEFYHHLITKHNETLKGIDHSPGAVKVWQRLSDMDGLDMHGVTHKGEVKYIKNWHNTKETHSTDMMSPKGQMVLVAKKKQDNINHKTFTHTYSIPKKSKQKPSNVR